MRKGTDDGTPPNPLDRRRRGHAMTPHFTLAEFTKSQVASRRGYDNTAPEHVRKRLRLLAEAVLEPVRAHFSKPVRISSGYRCLALNEAVGSKPSSQHILGYAADFEVPGVPNIEVACWIRDNLEKDQLILEFYDGTPSGGWVHCSYREGKNRNIVLTISKNSTTQGLPKGD